MLWEEWGGRKEKRGEEKEKGLERKRSQRGKEERGITSVEFLNIRQNHYNDDIHTHIMHTHVQYRGLLSGTSWRMNWAETHTTL